MSDVLTIKQLEKNSQDGLKQAEAMYYKQAGVAEFVASLKAEGHELVKAETETDEPETDGE